MQNIVHLFRAIKIIIILSRQGILHELSQSSFIPNKILIWINAFNFFVGKKNKNPTLGLTLVDTLYNLGPAFVKLGQGLATRPDIIGTSLASELAILQDNMEPFSSISAKKIIFEETGKDPSELFEEFNDKPIAAASIAQVHKGKTFDGRYIAIKLLRPGIEKAISKDINFFIWCATLISQFEPNMSNLRLIKAVEIFRQITMDEMDFRLEAAAASELRENFKDDHRFEVPIIFWPLTSQRMLVLEWVDGIKINDKEALISGGHNIAEITTNASEAFFLQVFRDGFFHADMHPGNIFINSDSKLIPVDFGIMGRLKVKERIFLGKLLKAILDRDFIKVAQLHMDHGMLPLGSSVSGFAQAVRSISIPILDKQLGQISLGSLLGQLFGMANRWKLNIQPQFLLLQKTMVMAEGVGRQMNPETDMWKMSRPMVSEWLRSSNFRKSQTNEFINDFKLIIHKIPDVIEGLDSLNKSNKNQNKFKLSIPTITLLLLIGFIVGFII